jgi:hypothetical protein
MTNIYYSHSFNRQGTLRAALSSEECRRLLKEHPAQYVGQQFPTEGHSSEVDFALLSVSEEGVSEEYGIGFYLFDHDIMRIEEAVQSLVSGAVKSAYRLP